MRSTSRTGRLPSFLVIGAMKGGTTSLYHYLRAHPSIYMAPVKELDFFVESINWGRGIDWYRRQFSRAGDVIAAGEASTNYTKYPMHSGVAERVFKTVPGARLIYLLRNPVERIRSHYQHRVAIGWEKDPLDVAIEREPGYLDCSRYAMQVEEYLRCFPRSQLLLITSEDLRDQRSRTMLDILRFLDLDNRVTMDFSREYLRTSERRTYSPFLGSIRKTVKQRFPQAKRLKEHVDTGAFRSRGLRLPVHVSRPAIAKDPSDLLNDVTRSKIEKLLRDDVERLYRYMPEGFHGWGIV